MAWLTGYNYRKALTVDATKIDANLTDFPTLVHLHGDLFTYLATNVCIGATATADTENGSEVAGNAIDGNTATFWTSATTGTPPRWLKVDLGASNEKTVRRYSITIRSSDAAGKPTAWQLQGSNTGAFAGEETVLDSQTGQTFIGDGPNTYIFSNATAYRYYRLYITATSGGVYVQIREFVMNEATVNSANFDFSKARADLNDIKFTSADESTELKHELDSIIYDGALYGSDVLTGGTASGDTNGGAWSNPANVVDNNDGTFGNSVDAAGDHWWKYDLGAAVTKTVTKVRFKPYNNAWGNSIKDFSIQGSNNNVDWDTLYTGQHANTNAWETYFFTNVTAYRYYRIYMTTTWMVGHTLMGIYEAEMMETTSPVPDIIQAFFWVKAPAVDATVDTLLYVYYDNAAETSPTEDPTNVWDSYHKGVWHLSEEGQGTASEFADSTGNSNHGTAQNTVTRVSAGKVGYSQDFNGSRITVGDSVSLEPGTQDLTWSLKVKFDSASGNRCFIGRDTSGTSYFYFAYESTGIRFRDYNSGDVISFDSPWTPSAGVWYDIEVTRSGSSWKLFVDNSQLGATDTDADGFLDRAQGWVIGGHATINYNLDGQMDEVRMSFGIARSDAWRKARIESDNDTLLSFGSEETEPLPSFQLNPALQWYASGLFRLSPALQWFAAKITALTPGLDWYSTGPKFAPNLVHYPLYFDLPSIKQSAVTLGWTGCLPGYSLTLKNTGSSGQTVIEIYVQGILKDTLTVPADGSSYVKLQHLLMDTLLNPLDELEVKITEVATGAIDVKVDFYEMTFPFSMEILDCGNLNAENYAFWGLQPGWVFTGATSWFVEVNQPILEVVSAFALDGDGTETEITATVENGHFYRNRLVISSVISTATEKLRFYVKDLGQVVRTIEKNIVIKTQYADFPDYAVPELITTAYGADECVGGVASDTEERTPVYGPNLFDRTLGTPSASVNAVNAGNAFHVPEPGGNEFWSSNVGGGLPQWLSFDLGEGNESIIHKYIVRARTNYIFGILWAGDPNSWPTAWQFQGSDDGVTWVDLDTQSGIVWTMADTNPKEFLLPTNNIAYRHYRLYMTASTGTYVQIRQLSGFLDTASVIPYQLVDDNIATYWPDPVTTTVPQYWMYDFGAANAKQIEQIQLLARSDADGLYAKDFILAGSNLTTPDIEDNADWTYIYGNRLDPASSLYGQYQAFDFTNSVAYRHYRLTLVNTYNTAGKVGVLEMMLQEVSKSESLVKIFESYLPFESYQYSFDGGVTWIDGVIVGNRYSTAVDFTGKTEGTYTVNFKYIVNGLSFEASKEIIYDPDNLSCYVQFFGGYFTVSYQDTIALEKVELYKDGTLINTYVPMTGHGFTTCTVDKVAKTLTVSSGTLFYQGEAYTWDGSAKAVVYGLTGDQQVRAAFGFNTSTKEFELKVYTPSQYGVVGSDSFDNFIIIWIQDLVISVISDLSSWAINGTESQWNIFQPDQLGFATTENADYQVIVYDKAGRTRAFNLAFRVLVDNVWYNLTVTDSEGNVVIPGQIVSDASLTYTVDENDR